MIIDDGSTDNSYNICKKYANNDNRIKVIHQENHGISYVRNFGVKLAKGNYIFWIDSDDYIKENIIEKLYENLIKCDADISICDFIKGSETDYIFPDSNNIAVECFDNKRGLELIYKMIIILLLWLPLGLSLLKRIYITDYNILTVKFLKIFI